MLIVNASRVILSIKYFIELNSYGNNIIQASFIDKIWKYWFTINPFEFFYYLFNIFQLIILSIFFFFRRPKNFDKTNRIYWIILQNYSEIFNIGQQKIENAKSKLKRPSFSFRKYYQTKGINYIKIKAF